MTLPIGAMLGLATALRASHRGLWVVALRLRLWGLLTHHTLIMSACGRTTHLDWVVLLIWILRGLIGLKYVWRSRSLQLAIAHVLRLSLTRCTIARRYKRRVLSKDLLEVQTGSRCSLLFLHLSVVQLDQGLKFAHNIRPIVWVIGTRIVRKPKDP